MTPPTEISFNVLVVSLATSAAVHFGDVKDSSTGERSTPNLAAAGHMIELLAVLEFLGQRGQVFWLYGLSGSGQSTLAHALERRLHGEGVLTRLLDGDNIRTGLTQIR